jgi:hypothetical protein
MMTDREHSNLAGAKDAPEPLGFVDGVPLRRVMSIGELHPVQTLEVMRAVLAGVAEAEAAGWGCAVTADSVSVGGDGIARVAVDPHAPPSRALPEVAALLRAMLDRGPQAGVGSPASLALAGRLRSLAEPGGLDACGSVAEARTLLDAEASGDGDGTAAQLAPLVAAVRGRPPATTPAVPPRRVTHSGTPADHRRLLLIGGAAAVALLVASGAAFLFLHRHHTTAATPAIAPPQPTPPPSAAVAAAAPTPAGPQAVPALGPASTATVSSVAAPTLVGPCPPTSTQCTIAIRVVLPPHATESVAWNVAVVDRCTGAVNRQPGGSLTALSRYGFVFDNTRITLPGNHPAGVVVLTSAPSAAASSPLLLGPPGC